jgi:NAD(P)-dependent dehydrogenase (short-subunit alcohol dehydrogenase family)
MGLVDGKAGVVTGAAGGLGREAAILFAAEGASVVITDLESQREGGEETVAIVEQAGGRAIFVAGDVTDDDHHRRLVSECVSTFGGLDFAHNNAGVDLQARIVDTTEEQWDRTLDINLKGVFLGMKHQLIHMYEQGRGSIVNSSSVAGLSGVRGLAAYVASKHGIVGLTKAGALEAGEFGVRVNCVCPGVMRTPMVAALDPAKAASLGQGQAIKRLMEPSEVAEMVVWLASDRASVITGIASPADLGTSAGRAR